MASGMTQWTGSAARGRPSRSAATKRSPCNKKGARIQRGKVSRKSGIDGVDGIRTVAASGMLPNRCRTAGK